MPKKIGFALMNRDFRDNRTNMNALISPTVIVLLLFQRDAHALFSTTTTIGYNYCLSRANHLSITKRKTTKLHAASTEILDPLMGCFRACQSAAAENEGLLTDIVTCGTINTASDAIAQLFLETTDDREEDAAFRYNYDRPRTVRLGVFGLLDGAVSNAWFFALDSVVGDGQGFPETLAKTLADALVYTPIWCAWFLSFMTVAAAEPSSIRECVAESIPSVLKSDWMELLGGNLGFFLPITGLIYGFVPRDERVLAFGVASLLYTIVLSAWNNQRVREEKAYIADDTGMFPATKSKLFFFDAPMDADCFLEKRPSSSARAILPYGVRRVVVRARSRMLR